MVVVDGGSRGALFEPFNKVDKQLLKVLRFEPDPGATVLKSEGEVAFNKGLWKEEAKIRLNLARNPSTSSVYPANQELLEKFDDKVGYPPRSLDKLLEVECIDIDTAVQNENVPLVNFIKLDIHGAEYEAIQGAARSLSDACVGCMVESWFIDIHQGQKLIFDVEARLAEMGFYKFGNTQVISWPRKRPEGLKSKDQIIAEENLYLKVCSTVSEVEQLGKDRAIKLLVVADLFGYTDYALQLLELMGGLDSSDVNNLNSLRKHIISNNRIGFKDKVLTAAIHKLRKAQSKRF